MPKSYELAKGIVKKLFDNNYPAYFAGGWVRDFLRQEPSNDIDIATAAPPNKIISLFPKTVPVGIAFGVIIVVIDGIQFEVSTFRKDHPYHDGRHPEGVDYSTAENDAKRRDFTINGMFYDPLTERVIDYVGGKDDLEKKVIRAIGNPTLRFSEDRLRMIRAIRFATRFNFTIDQETEQAIISYSSSLFPSVSMERIYQELSKMAKTARFDEALVMMHRLGLLTTIFHQLIGLPLENLRERVKAIPYFPLDTPPILSLFELFDGMGKKEKMDLCRYLKTSNEELEWVEFLEENQPLLLGHQESLIAWAHFYADVRSDLLLSLFSSKLPVNKREAFLSTHEKRKERLAFHIQRLKEKKPIVTASHLQKEGIAAGKEMGLLLRRAEAFAIEEDLHDPDAIIAKLKVTPLWPS